MKRKDVMQFLKETETSMDHGRVPIAVFECAASIFEKQLEIQKTVDRAFELDQKVKTLNAELSALKDEIKAYARRHTLKEVAGNAHRAVISGTTTTEIPFSQAFNYFKRHKLPIDGVFSVKVGEFKKIAGSVGLEDVGATVEKTEFYSVSFK